MKHPFSSSQRGSGKLIFLVLLLAVGTAARGISSRLHDRNNLREAAATAAVVHVLTALPESGGAAATLVLPATVEAWSEAPILARTSGYLKRWLVDIGTPVKAGQLLAEIEAPEIDAQLQQAQADLATAKANQLFAISTAKRYRDLIGSHAVSQQDADTKFAAELVALSNVQSASANVSRLRQLADFKRVVAPFDGVVTARNTDVGALISAGSGTALFKVADLSRLRLYVQVPQAYAGGIKPGLTAEFTMADHPGKTYQATVTSTSQSLDNNRSLQTQLTVENTSGELLAGSYAEVRLNPDVIGAPALLRVPANVLLFRADGLQVATVGADGLVHLKNIRVARDLGTAVEIAEGLVATDQVVLNPPDSIAENAPVQASAAPKPEVKPEAKSVSKV